MDITNICSIFLKVNKLQVGAGGGDGKASSGERPGDDDKPDVFSAADSSLLTKIIRKGLVEAKQDLDIQRKDPNSPLYSVKSFEALKL